MKTKITALFALLGVLTLFTNCTTGISATESQNQNVASMFSSSITEYGINAIYEPGAEPYVGNLGVTTNKVWDISKSSYQSLFQGRTRSITVPFTLADMTPITAQNHTTWDSSSLIDLGNRYAKKLLTNNKISVSVIFVKGTYEGNTSILGIHFTGLPFAFIFKDVVLSTGGSSLQQQYVEQATIVHELGHITGLVNNGVPLTSNHEDASHPHHTTNSQCVMYWAEESSTTILTSVSNFILGSQLNLFGPEVRSDAAAYNP